MAVSQQFRAVNIDPTPRTMVRRLRNLYVVSQEHFPEIHDRGLNWYGNVHDAAQKAARESGKTTRQAAGVVAAVSPNMDWERNNISAFHEIDSLTPEHWGMIHHSSSQDGRTDEVKSLLREHAPGLSRASDRDLLKAHRIWHGGEDPESVLIRQKAPKTNTFFRNINEPHLDHGATVDGRHADIIADAMRPWQSSGRGISSADLKSGKRTRYEQYSDATRMAANGFTVGGRRMLPHEMQAVDWELGKLIERGFDPSRSKGDARTHQSYQGRVGHFLSGLA